MPINEIFKQEEFGFLGNHTGWLTVIAPADRPQSVGNRCVIERICSVFDNFTYALYVV